MAFSQAPPRGPETTAEAARVGPGSYKIPTTLQAHPLCEKPAYVKFSMEQGRNKLPPGAGDGPDCDTEKLTAAVRSIISTSRRAPTVKFGTEEARPDYGRASITKNSRFVLPSGQVGEKQAVSHRRTAPSFSLSTRTKYAGRKGEYGIGVPGPEYELPSVMGKAPSSRFGMGARASESDGMEQTPGPGSFQQPPAIGNQIESTLRSASTASLVGGGRDAFGSAFGLKSSVTPSPAKYRPENCRHAVSKGVPRVTIAGRTQAPETVGQGQSNRVGPGSYKIPTTLESHPLCEKPQYTRFSQAKRPDMSDASASQVAPHDYETSKCFASLSTTKTLPRVGFAKGGRGDFTSVSNMTPSPAKYDVRSVNYGYLTGYRKPPAASLSGRTSFGSIFA